jgi:2-dehydro-3-deoxyphosphogluconate aldolase / (4S)-4-hydroxy-2-oxoglutarate aldolase
MNGKNQLQQLITSQGVLPLYYTDSEMESVEIMRALYKGGIRVFEYTNRGRNALDNFLALKKTAAREFPGLTIGVGTIKTVTDAEIFLAAGADFLVSPIIDPSIGDLAAKRGLLWIPGCMTATEVNHAESSGATLVKIFPGNLLGPTYIGSLREIFPNLSFMPTGGVDLTKENIRTWFNAGAVALGLGSRLFTKALMDNKDYDSLSANCNNVLDLVRSIRT